MANRSQDLTRAERLFLMYNYIVRHCGRKRIATKQEIMDYLGTKGVDGLHDNTFYSDIHLLRDGAFGLDLEYSDTITKAIDDDGHVSGGYLLQNPLFEPHELRLMIDGVQSAKFIPQRTADALCAKIRNLASDEDYDVLNRRALVINRSHDKSDSALNEADAIYKAIAEEKQVSFRYFHLSPDKNNPKTYTKEGQRRIVSPYALFWDNGFYYLYAYEKKRFLTFRIDRMDNIRLIPFSQREGREEYHAQDITKRKAYVFGMYRSKEVVNVSLRFHRHITDAIVDVFGSDVMMIPTDENHFSITVAVEVSLPFYAWVATFGRSIKITNPPKIVKNMREFLQKSADMYKDEGET